MVTGIGGHEAREARPPRQLPGNDPHRLLQGPQSPPPPHHHHFHNHHHYHLHRKYTADSQKVAAHDTI